ncbi:hypothetical protein I3843_05G097300 [Carya illinoinensis]|uniref:Uncharacterized protein n=2 Tax=Carya illinoinensis TaxID=32201 RepID=A0A8T1QHK3_CARIL|nr:uncharacterized protein LOC122311724 [Carya illinoinensis]KAG6653869.1 hypothetical protein CIPAW_05G107000 [Carya illinoinensis]KAG6712451.1 hypothetical protein I3842_05G104400 [Carya illinoinensis]KAG7978747.1 hypothetical protein I3843_05G097300 [Carya illinoinensis]KAG7978748.1 hypothetical protein I3843_05G097300 [Carya illinoinensis]
MKLKKGKVYPSPSSSSSTSAIPSPSDGDFLTVLKLLPAAILALASVLSLEDREVLAYMITRSLKPTTPSPITQESKRKNPKKSLNSSNSNKISNNTHKPPMFDCDCFDCYTNYWFRWDSSPNRELIHQAIEAFEDHLAHGEQSKKVNGRGKRREKPSSRRASGKSADVSETPITQEIEESYAFSVTSPENDVASASWTDKGDVSVEGSGKDKNKEHEVAIEEVVVEKEEEEEATVVETAMVAASSSNNHKGLARKVLPDVLGLLNSRWWSLWSPNVW